MRIYYEKRNSIIVDEVLGNYRTCRDVSRDFHISAQAVHNIVKKMHRYYFLGSIGLSYPNYKYPSINMKKMRKDYNR